MTPELWKRLDELFDVALGLPAGEREAFARAQAEGELREELLSLLRAEAQSEGLLAEPIGHVAALIDGVSEGGSLEGGETDPLLGLRLGSYTIVSVIGRGGMGVVYEARQDSPQRTVALKVVRPGAL